MPEWNENQFQHLLTSSIWSSNADKIKEILELPNWQDSKFKKLITPTLWVSTAENIKERLELEYWNNEKYEHLLVPSIFSINIRKIKDGIELFEKYKISDYITCTSLRKGKKEQECLIQYMIKNNLSLIVEDSNCQKKISPLLNASSTVLKEKYGIDIKKIIKEIEEIDR